VPPKGWERVDRRTPVPVASVPAVRPAPAPAAASGATVSPIRRPRRNPDDDVSLFDAPSAPEPEPATAPDPEPAPAPPVLRSVPEPAPTPNADVSWLPRNATEQELDSVLSASSPLLSRAFRNARGDGGEPEADEHVDPDAF
jgi:hypothetical protein